MLVLAPVALVMSALAWFFVIRFTRLASLASLVAVSVAFVSLVILHLVGWQAWRPVGWSVILLGIALGGLVFYRHRSNIGRLAAGRELKITTQ